MNDLLGLVKVRGPTEARERAGPPPLSPLSPCVARAARRLPHSFFSTFPPPHSPSIQPAGAAAAAVPTPPSVSRSQARREAAEDAALAAAADGAAGPSTAASAAGAAALPADPKMAEFFAEVAAIKGALAGIRDAQAALSRAHEQSKTVTRGREMATIREKMQVRGWVGGGMVRGEEGADGGGGGDRGWGGIERWGWPPSPPRTSLP